LKLMIDSKEGPQAYQLFKHEFQNVAASAKGGYTFTLRVFEGKSVNDIRATPIAKDLLVILQQSNKAAELTDEALYQFVFDKNLMLHITREEAPVETD